MNKSPRAPVGRVSPQGVTRQSAETLSGAVGLRCANPTYAAYLRRGHISRRRNPLILKNAPNVEFREIAHLFIARFAQPSFVAGETAERQETTQETTGSVGAQRILELLKTNPDATRQQLAAQTGLSADGVKYHLNKLKTAGRIRHVGSTKSGYWEILDGEKEEGEGL